MRNTMRKCMICILVLALTMVALVACKGEKMEQKIDLSAISDVCILESEITIESTVAKGWDENLDEIMAAIRLAVKEAGIVDGMPQVEAIIRINKFLCSNLVYGENVECRTIRGALINRRAVCVGYTLAFQYIAQYCGINAVYVHGYAGKTPHAWNGVYFSDGTYLEVDVTMNDLSGYKEKFLLVTSKEMALLH